MIIFTGIWYPLINIAIPDIEPLSSDTILIIFVIRIQSECSQGYWATALYLPKMFQQRGTITLTLIFRFNGEVIDKRTLEEVNHIGIANKHTIIFHGNKVNGCALIIPSQEMKIRCSLC